MVSSETVLGLGGTVDYEIDWNSAVLEGLAAEYGVTVSELTTDHPIITERDLLVSVLAMLKTGSGGERFVASSGIVETFAARFTSRVTLGGTGVRAALAMRVLGVTSTLHLVSIDDHVRRLLPPGIDFISSAVTDTTDPHLIIQFPVGATVCLGGTLLTATHANRLIYSNDPPNQTLYLSDELPSALSTATLFLISGFNSMQDAQALDERLDQLRSALSRLAPGSTVFYEDSGFHRPEFSPRVRAALLDAIDVYSLNEDELETHLGHPVDLLDPHAVRSALDDVARLIPARHLIVHTKYFSAAIGERPELYREALRGGILMASTRYRFGDGFTRADYDGMAAERVSPAGAIVAAALSPAAPPAMAGAATPAVSAPGAPPEAATPEPALPDASAPLGAARTIVCIPAFQLDDPTPTTIGLGDSFVGGFIAALRRGRAL
ncbi:ADP-dependent glucokinase/phosphofructokinase [Subtercola sp. RTI3]|uniref:ADP-dependent glucokinase/phosphofructokinase n=1 Tax=Subtercola sp. RTI3 TaxID=3048639 RepID=UPI002B2251FC|nr:ADP-dependent glucokinase/phosphofructokinase [Subtercola sp. RTI3]MEA9985929.1 ADP-dependent glucokinase/phosphofructokinase [Subtercola sp. RTI3]